MRRATPKTRARRPATKRTTTKRAAAKGAMLRASSTNQATGPAYRGASTGRRFIGFPTTRLGPTAALVYHGAVLRARARQLLRDDAFVWRGIKSLVANIIGTGITPESTVEDPDLSNVIRREWEMFDDECDADGSTTFYGLQALGCSEMLVAGEAFGRFRTRRSEDGFRVPLQIQMFEAEHCPLNEHEDLGARGSVRAGIRFGPFGRREAYRLYREHPDDLGVSLRGSELVEVPAAEVLHVYERARAGQLRGESRLARILLTAHDLGQFRDGTLLRQKIGAAVTAIIERNNPDMLPTVADADATVPADGELDATIPLGSMYTLGPGESIKFIDGPTIGADYDPFMTLGLRELAAGMGTLYEFLSGDYEGVTYSSVRAAICEFRRECEQIVHSVFVPQFCAPVWRRWMTEAVLAGTLPISRANFRANPQKYLAVHWVGTKYDWVDPMKDVQAEIAAVEAGFKSRDSVIRALGENPEDVDRERRKSKERSETEGVPVASASVSVALAPESDERPAGRRRRVA